MGDSWTVAHGLVMRICTVPVDFETLNDPVRTQTWTSQSLAVNEAIAMLLTAKL